MKLRKMLIEQFLPLWAKETVLYEKERLNKENERLERENAELRAFIDGVKLVTRRKERQ